MFEVALLRVEEHSFWKQGKGQKKKTPITYSN